MYKVKRSGNKKPAICNVCNSKFCGPKQFSNYKECPCSTCILVTLCNEECNDFGQFSKDSSPNKIHLRTLNISRQQTLKLF